MTDERSTSPFLGSATLLMALFALAASSLSAVAQAQDQRQEQGQTQEQNLDIALDLQEDEDLRIPPAQPDYTLVVVPTALRVPLHQSAFRVTHRFARPVNRGSIADLAKDAFGLDGGAFIGLEYRFGLLPGLQVGLHRTSLDKTIEFFTQYGVLRQRGSVPVDVSAWVSVDGIRNFRDDYSPGVGAIISRIVGQHAAFYVEPIWIGNSNPVGGVGPNDTFMAALGGRLRVRPSVYVVGEWTPRLAGYAPGTPHGAFAIEKRIGGHVFQLNFSNAVGTTMAQMARGGLPTDDWYLGFNISRRFN